MHGILIEGLCYTTELARIMRFMEAREALPSQVFQVVAKSNQRARAGKGHILLLDQTTKGTVPSGRGLATKNTVLYTLYRHMYPTQKGNTYPQLLCVYTVTNNMLDSPHK